MVTAAVIGGVIAAGATTASYFEQKKTAREVQRRQEESNRISSSAAQVENARNRRRAIAQARIAQAQSLASTGGAVQSSSAIQGNASGLASQLGSNIGFQGAQVRTQQGIMNQQQAAANAQMQGNLKAGMWQGIGQIAMTAGQLGATMGSPSMPAGGGTGARASVNTGGFNPGNNMYDPRTGFTGVGL